MPLADGDTFAGFTIVRLLGSGGMGEVYLARHPRLPRRDALKVLPTSVSADSEFRERFNREADLAAELWHPHIVGVHDRGEFDGRLWISMDYVEGADAARLSRETFPDGMPAADVVEIVSAVAEALDYAHARRLLHRDVKPANILLTEPGNDGRRRILLADFGIARHADDVTGLTATNMTIGSVSYTAPEQLMGEDLDGRADQYALAATAYHLLTGTPVFPHTNPTVVISRHLNTPPPAVSAAKPQLGRIDVVLTKGLAKSPADRFESCSAFAAALADAALGLDDSPPSAVTGPTDPLAATPSEPTVHHHVPPTVVSDWGERQEHSETAAAEPAPPIELPKPPVVAAATQRGVSPALVTAAAIVGVALIAAITFVALQQFKPADTDRAESTATGSPPTGTLVVPPTAAPPTMTTAVTPPPLAASAIDQVLLTRDEVNSILGTYGSSGTGRVGLMKVESSTYGMSDNSSLVKPPSCVGVVFGAEHGVYADTGFDAMRDQTFTPEPYVYDATGSAPYGVEQTVIVFPNSAQAAAVVASAEDRWQRCASGEVYQTVPPENGFDWKLGGVARRGDVLTVSMASNSHIGPRACQQVLGIRKNVVVGTRSCNDVDQSFATEFDPVRNGWPVDLSWATDDAERLATAMLNKITD